MSIPRVYLRRNCTLPPDIDLQQSHLDGDWNAVAEISGWDLNDRVLEKGWQCIWVSGKYSRIGIGGTAEGAAAKAVVTTLNAVPASWNAAEIDSISVASYMAFSVARVTMHARHIQKDRLPVPGRIWGKVMYASEEISQ